MASFMRHMISAIGRGAHHKRQAAKKPTVMETLASQYTGKYAFLDELTNKTHQLAVSSELAIMIDGRTLPGTVTGITTEKLTFLDHYGYQLVITSGSAGPAAIYDEAEDATYQIIAPPAPDEEQ